MGKSSKVPTREPWDLGQDGFSGGDPCKGASLGIVVFDV